MNTKIRLLMLGIKQVELVKMVNDKGVSCNACQLNIAINEKNSQPKFGVIRDTVDEILTEIEGKRNGEEQDNA